MLDPVAQSAAAITHEILVKEPALYTNLYTDGGFNCRVSPVSGTISNHSWGTAIDIRVRNAAYEFGRNSVVTMALLRAYGYFHANGWWWGFGWGDPFEDNMHFQPGQVVLDYFRTVKAVTKTL